MTKKRTLLQVFTHHKFPFIDLARHYAAVFDETRHEIVNVYLSELQPSAEHPLSETPLSHWRQANDQRLDRIPADLHTRLLEYVQQRHFNTVVCHDAQTLFTLNQHRKPIRFNLIGVVDRFDRNDRKTLKLFSRLDKDNVFLLTTSNALLKDILDTLPQIPKKRIHTCYPGLNLKKLKAGQLGKDDARLRLKLNKSDFIIANVEPIEPGENQLSVLEGFELICKSCPRAKLVFMGNGSSKQSVARYARRMLLGDGIYFHDTHENTNRYLKAFDAMIWSSDTRGFNLQLLSAMASGIPIIAASGSGTTAEIVQDPAWLFGEKDVNQLAYQIRQVYELPDEDRQTLKTHMYSRLNQRFSARACRKDFRVSELAQQIDP